MKIDISEVQHIARLARLKLPEDQVPQLTGQINQILDYVDKLSELDTTGIEPMAHALSLDTPYREDAARSSLEVEDSLSNAPSRQGSFFQVPKVI